LLLSLADTTSNDSVATKSTADNDSNSNVANNTQDTNEAGTALAVELETLRASDAELRREVKQAPYICDDYTHAVLLIDWI
jgi:hypothetical protein